MSWYSTPKRGIVRDSRDVVPLAGVDVYVGINSCKFKDSFQEARWIPT